MLHRTLALSLAPLALVGVSHGQAPEAFDLIVKDVNGNTYEPGFGALDYASLSFEGPSDYGGTYFMPDGWVVMDAADLNTFINGDLENRENGWADWAWLLDPHTESTSTGETMAISALFPDEYLNGIQWDYSALEPVTDFTDYWINLKRFKHHKATSLSVHNWCQPLLYDASGVTTTTWRGYYHRWSPNGAAWSNWDRLILDRDQNNPDIISLPAWARHLMLEQALRAGIVLPGDFFASKHYSDLVRLGLSIITEGHATQGADFVIAPSTFPTVDVAGTSLPGLTGGATAPHRKTKSRRVRIALSNQHTGGGGAREALATSVTGTEVHAGQTFDVLYHQQGGENDKFKIKWSSGAEVWCDSVYAGYTGVGNPLLHGDTARVQLPANAPLGTALIVEVSTLDGIHHKYYDVDQGWNRLEVVANGPNGQ